jgi:aryl-alcohol dehydrogenase-like predicted oxidoreductase
MSCIGLGSVQFGSKYGISNIEGQTSQIEVLKILNLAKNYGIDLLDTASSYGNAEEILGQSKLNFFKIVSKFIPPDQGQTIKVQLDNSLKKLNLNSIYAYLAHRPMCIIDNPEYWVELNELKQMGLIKKIGYSLNTPSELDVLLEKNFTPDLIQVPYNYFDQRFEKHLIELSKNGCEIHTRSVFLQGLFFINPQKLSPFFDTIKPTLKNIQESTIELAGSLLNFVMDKSFIDYVIIGIENSKQLNHNMKSIKLGENLPVINDIINDRILMPSCWPKM